MMFGKSSKMVIRPPAVAGSFYPGDAKTLSAQVDDMLADAPVEGSAKPRAMIVPHAGYIYSGPTAAAAFRCFQGQEIHRVILLGPSHRMSFSGGALPGVNIQAFEIPTGSMKLDLSALETLRRNRAFQGPEAAHRGEHSLEVQLPFIKKVCPDATLVPVLIGASSGQEELQKIAKTIAPILDDNTVIVVSSDFSHFGAAYGWAPFPAGPELQGRLFKLCSSTAELISRIEAGAFERQVEISGDTVCGRHPIYVLLQLLSHALTQAEGKVLRVSSSGDRNGDYSQAVSYASILFSGRWHTWTEAAPVTGENQFSPRAARAIPKLARATLETLLGHGPEIADFYLESGDIPELKWPAGAFVTLNHRNLKPGTVGRLRACMGLMDSSQSLEDAVVDAAVSASRDPRFPRLKVEELQDLSIEVSVLSPTRSISSYEEIVLGRDGIVLSKGGRRAVFLPQVAIEQGWDLETTLAHLSRKAGLPVDGWKNGANFSVFRAHVFEESKKVL